MAEETQDKKPEAKGSETKASNGDAKPNAAAKGKAAGAKPKKEKPPAVEDKPFEEFITSHFIPEVEKSLKAEGIDDIHLSLEKRPIPIKGFDQSSTCSQVVGHWNNDKRTFFIAFQKDDIKAPKFYAASDSGSKPATLESFMIDERKVTLDLMVFYVVQRLNGQKWLTRN
ncbi:MAG: DUF2996 domain-containing protein [Leptolyngbyaceae bacterium]|nr:DUF2996 domain-containing protein [Leptolyngbyaceae bacterium]